MSDWINSLCCYIKDNNLGEARTDYTFKMLTTLKVGGNISLTYFPNTYLSFLDFYFYFKTNFNIPFLIIGNGSNILASDKPYNGLVISFKNIKEELEYIENDNNYYILTSSGVLSKTLSDFAYEKVLGGLEPIGSIPATIGGIIAMNATCFGYESKNYLQKCLVLDEDQLYWLNVEEMEFEYRNSIFLKKKLIILKALFKFDKKSKEDINKRTKEILEIRKRTQPVNHKSAGSTFKNGVCFSAWELIDKANLRGYKIGGARISTLHTNFLINENNATSLDIYNLMKHVIEVVYDKFQILLENEWVIINYCDTDLKD